MQSLGSFKRGDTFSFVARLKDKTGAVVTLPADKISCEIRTERYVLVAELTVTQHPTEVGSYIFTAIPFVTKTFPLGVVLLDIEMNSSGEITSTETFSATIVKDVTNYGE